MGAIEDPAAMDLQVEYPELNDIVTRYGPERLNLPAMFPDRKGFGVNRLNRKKIDYLVKAQDLLPNMLWQGEVIEFVTRAVRAVTLEYLFGGGYWARFINITTMVITNYRVLLINTDSSGEPKNMLYQQIQFDQIKKVKTGSFGYLQFKLGAFKSLSFREAPRRDRKHIKQVLDQKIAAPMPYQAGPAALRTGGVENLCTSCYGVVPAKQYACPHCQTGFRTPLQAAWRSLILPGLGDLYLKHHALAAIEIIGSLIVYGIFASAAIQEGTAAGFIIMAAAIVFINVADAVATYFIAQKGLIPE